MKRFALTCLLAVAVVVVAAPASADTSFRIRLFACAVGVPGTNVVPADTALFWDGGWTSGSRGLVESAIHNSIITVTDTRGGISTVHTAQWGRIVQDNFLFPGSWTANWRI